MQSATHRLFTALLVLVCFAWLRAGVAQAGQLSSGRVRGVVSDDSGGVIPGVTVTATLGDGTVVGSTVTDGAGSYDFEQVPVSTVLLTFELEGFASAEARVPVTADADIQVLQKLLLAPHTETVNVVGRAPAPPPPPIPLPPPPPDPIPVPVPVHDRDSICGPAKAEGPIESFGRVRGHRDADRGLYGPGDVLAIDGGTTTGLEMNGNYVVRRAYRTDGSRQPTREHSAGLLQIVELNERESLAVVIYACDAFMSGDMLAAFHPEAPRNAEPLGTPAYDDAAQILFADLGQLTGISQRLMVIDRGLTSNIHVGQTLTLFRIQKKRDPMIIGIAMVVAVKNDSATIRIDRALDEVEFGDWAAPQRYPQPAATLQDQ